MSIDKVEQNRINVKSKSRKKSRNQATPPTITVKMRTYKNDEERKKHLRMFLETVIKGGEGV